MKFQSSLDWCKFCNTRNYTTKVWDSALQLRPFLFTGLRADSVHFDFNWIEGISKFSLGLNKLFSIEAVVNL
jgi:hypothetical protein